MIILKILLILLAVVLVAFAALRTRQYLHYAGRQRARNRTPKSIDGFTLGLYGVGILLLVIALLIGGGGEKAPEETQPEETQTVPETTEPPAVFAPYQTADTDPANWGITWEIFKDGQPVSAYQREDPITFGEPEDYFAFPGIATFRGNNYRNSPSYGTASVTEKTLSLDWARHTGALGVWSGSGWTGQPLMAAWDDATRQNMNLYPEKKAKSGLVEVIYATLDGHIYFMDLEDGTATRDPVSVGQCFKGAGALDPRGYPLMYVGSGDVSGDGKLPRMYIISLIDGSILYQHGNADPLAQRQDNGGWCAFDSSPLVHGQSDTLIWPGENGILYTMRLNTNYDAQNGTLSISPDNMVVTRYNTSRTGTEKYWSGYEASANIVENYLYVSENGGMFYCVDLNTMELIWAQDTKDDSNCSPVFERTGEDSGAIYTAPSLHWTRSANMDGTISLYKLDAITGEILWETPYPVHTVDGVSGGVQSTPLLGKPGTALDGLIVYTISRTPDVYTGLLVALDTQTGQEVWRMSMDNYAWSSPVPVYSDDGAAYIAVGDSAGNLFFIEGSTGTKLDSISLGGLIEATPAVYEDMLVVGTRAQQICGVKIK